ncbi:MAG: histidine triad nucleotide-binding protein [Candidatus Melainabacteria bacterium GWA2_34_9]|nr:MAG: histidine triad nucleotide-binding protein [Candidatus Melainabacteria bacterium GWA2_34_9]
MNKDCIFCKIANKEIKTELILETNDYVSFKDLNPQAPFHALVITKEHFSSLNDLEDLELMGKLLEGVQKTAEKLGIKENYRTVINTGKGAGQAVFHIHVHVIGGRPLDWPPG